MPKMAFLRANEETHPQNKFVHIREVIRIY